MDPAGWCESNQPTLSDQVPSIKDGSMFEVLVGTAVVLFLVLVGYLVYLMGGIAGDKR